MAEEKTPRKKAKKTPPAPPARTAAPPAPAKTPGTRAGKKPVRNSVFRRPIKEKRLRRKYLKFIEIEADREFFLSCFTPKDGKYHPVSPLEPARLKKLKSLSKVIKKNRGAVKAGPLVLTGVLAAGLVIFFLFFLNPFLETTLERGLENLFEAKVEINGFNLSLIRFNLSMDSLTVADRDKPMQNLFETGRLAFRLKPAALFRGKVYIEEARAASLQFGTERKTSGALRDYEARQAKKAQKAETPPLINLAAFDAQALLEQEFDKLKTPRAYDEAAAAYNQSVEKWEARVDSSVLQAKELEAAVKPVLAIDISQLKTPEAIRQAIEDITALIKSADKAVTEVNGIISGIQADVDTASGLERMARTAVNDDIEHLKSYVDFKSGAVLEALEPAVRNMLSDNLEQYINYGLRFLEVAEELKANSQNKEKTEKPKAKARQGRDVHYPGAVYPAFYMETLASDFTLNGWNWGLELEDVSSDPDLSARPVSLTLGLAETEGSENRACSFSGILDLREKAEDLFSAVLAAERLPMNIRNGLESLGIGGFKGSGTYAVQLSGEKNGAFSAGGTIAIAQPELLSPSGTLAEALDTAVRGVRAVTMDLQFTSSDSGEDFSLDSNILEIAGDALRAVAERYARQAAAEIETYLRQYVADNLEGKLASKEELDALFSLAKGDKAALDTLTRSLENKQKEFENKLRSAAEDAVQKAAQEAEAAAKKAAQDALESLNIPSISIPGRR